MKNYIIIFISLLFLNGCATVSKKLDNKVVHQEGNAYIYGKFQVDSTPGLGIVLTLKQYDIKNPRFKKDGVYGLKFNQEGDVYAISVKPGTYRLLEFEFTQGWDEVYSSKPISNEYLLQPFTVEPNKAYYVGDWSGETSQHGYPMVTTTWKLKSFTSNFENARRELTGNYKNLANLKNVEVFSPKYTASFDKNDPATFDLENLRIAYYYGDYEVAHNIADLFADKPEAKYYKSLLKYYGKGTTEDQDAAFKLLKEAAYEDKFPDAMYFLGSEMMKFAFELSKYETDEEQKKKYIKSALNNLLLINHSASLGSKLAMARMCTFANTSVEYVQNQAIAWCEIIADKNLKYGDRSLVNHEIDINEVKSSLTQENLTKIEEIKLNHLKKLEENNFEG